MPKSPKYIVIIQNGRGVRGCVSLNFLNIQLIKVKLKLKLKTFQKLKTHIKWKYYNILEDRPTYIQ